jgi:hypothetical protein
MIIGVAPTVQRAPGPLGQAFLAIVRDGIRKRTALAGDRSCPQATQIV